MFRGLWLGVGSGSGPGISDRRFDGCPTTKRELDKDNFRWLNVGIGVLKFLITQAA